MEGPDALDTPGGCNTALTCAHCGCVQIISTELNRAVVELLQQLLFWQERSKATAPYNVAKRKRLVSGLR